MSQKYCSSCGSPIPDGQGQSCSMCYGDMDYGKDGYYRKIMEDREFHKEEWNPEVLPLTDDF